MRHSRAPVAVVAAIGFLLAFGSTQAAYAQLTGAIFTTNSTGSQVNGNIYAAKTDVYLSGGPQNCNSSSGLPNGDYYFQVTDPNGSTLLSTDSLAKRRVTYFGGVMVAPYNGNHLVGSGKCGGISVALAPFADTPNPGGEYKAWLVPVLSVTALDGADETTSTAMTFTEHKTDNFKVRPCQFECGPNNPPQLLISGIKFYDTNANGAHDPGEPGINGWRIEKVPPTPADGTYTANGVYGFFVLTGSGSYTISEVFPGLVPQVWLPTTATSGSVTVGVTDLRGPNFGNLCVGAGGGLTLGFWSNKNGQALVTSADLTFLRGLNLRNANAFNFDPTTNTQLKSWLLGGNAVNMANMLSIQLSAMELNVLHNSVNGGALIFAPGTTSANGASFATVNAVMAEANASLGANACTTASGNLTPPCSPGAGYAIRSYQEALKNALDRGNNNLNFVLAPVNGQIPQACSFSTPY